MIKSIFLSWMLLFGFCQLLAQERRNWTALDYLNADGSYPLETENDIEGEFFITIAEGFNYYETPIVIADSLYRDKVIIEFLEGDVITAYNGVKYPFNDNSNPLNPWLLVLNPDYFRLALECIQTTESHFIVRLNEDEIGYIAKNDPCFKKESIVDFVGSWTVFGFDFDRSTNPLRTIPSVEGEIISWKEPKYKIWTGEVLEIEGEWFKVKTVKDEVGWIRWKEGSKVLIRMYYAC